jgi:tRNA A37 N6-isopentenylltransferase MiaA
MIKDEMEKYRDSDRQQEANNIPLTESQQKQKELEPIEFLEEAERTVKNLEIRLAESLEVNEAHQKINGKLQQRVTKLEEDNKKLAHEIEDRVQKMRKSGM